MTEGRTTDKRRRCPVTHYARQVEAGKIIAGKLVRLACQRHLADLESCHARGLYFDRDSAEFYIAKMQIFPQSKGEFGGQPIILGDWQKFIFGSLFGWKKADGTRRFRDAYIEVGKKNGKSTMLGAASNTMLYFDDEPGAEIYTAATTRDQAKIVYDEARHMLLAMPKVWTIRRKLEIEKHAVFYPEKAAKMLPLASDVDTVDGKNPHFVTIDEYHRHRTAKLYNVMKKSMTARRQGLLIAITTAGENKACPCWHQREYSSRVLEGHYENDAHFAYIASLDEGDDWRDEKVWIKANPNLGVSPKIESLRDECKVAQDMPSSLNDFLRYHMNMWVEGDSSWLNMETWDECGEDYAIEDLRGRACYGGLDLSQTQDLTAFALVFPPTEQDEKWRVLVWYWIPGDNIQRRVQKDRVPYDVWVRQEFVKATAGNTIDYDFVQADILNICSLFDVKEIAFDRWGSKQIVNNFMAEGLNMVEFGQGFASMAAPTKLLGDLIVSGQIGHNKNPVLRWNMANVTVAKDPAGNMKPDKGKSSEKIDGTVAVIMGIGRADVAIVGNSIYEERGILSL